MLLKAFEITLSSELAEPPNKPIFVGVFTHLISPSINAFSLITLIAFCIEPISSIKSIFSACFPVNILPSAHLFRCASESLRALAIVSVNSLYESFCKPWINTFSSSVKSTDGSAMIL